MKASQTYLKGVPFKVILFIQMMCSVYLSYEGAQQFLGRDGALIVAIAGGAFIYISWVTALRFVPNLTDPRSLAKGLMILALAIAGIIGLSSWLAVSGMARDSVAKVHMQAALPRFEEAAESWHARSVVAAQFLPDIRQEAALYRARRQSEITVGAYSGHPGSPGTVEQTLGGIASRLDAIAAIIEAHVTKTRELIETAHAVLARMRAAASADADPDLRMRELALETDKLRTLMAESDGRSLLGSIRRALDGLQGEVSLRFGSGKSKTVARDQKNALERIKRELVDTAERLGRQIDKLASLPAVSAPRLERINAVEGVVRYPLQHAPLWAAGLALDLTPLFVILYLSLMQFARGRQGVMIDGMGQLTAIELVQSLQVLTLIGQKRIDANLLQKLFGMTLGQDGEDAPKILTQEKETKDE